MPASSCASSIHQLTLDGGLGPRIARRISGQSSPRPWRRPHRHGGGAHPCPGPPPFLLPLLPPLRCGCSGQLRHNLALRALRRPRARSPCRCRSPPPLLRKKPTFSPPTEPTSPSSPSDVLQIDTRRVMLTLNKRGKTRQCLNTGSGRQCLSL